MWQLTWLFICSTDVENSVKVCISVQKSIYLHFFSYLHETVFATAFISSADFMILSKNLCIFSRKPSMHQRNQNSNNNTNLNSRPQSNRFDKPALHSFSRQQATDSGPTIAATVNANNTRTRHSTSKPSINIHSNHNSSSNHPNNFTNNNNFVNNSSNTHTTYNTSITQNSNNLTQQIPQISQCRPLSFPNHQTSTKRITKSPTSNRRITNQFNRKNRYYRPSSTVAKSQLKTRRSKSLTLEKTQKSI